jgi:hypothetical protein
LCTIRRRQKNIVAFATLFALELAMRGTIGTLRQETIAKFKRNGEFVFKQQFQ